MERLTWTTEQRKAEGVSFPKHFSPELCEKIDKRLKAYEDTGLSPERFAELAKADKEERLIISPYAVGDEIYMKCPMCKTEIKATAGASLSQEEIRSYLAERSNQ